MKSWFLHSSILQVLVRFGFGALAMTCALLRTGAVEPPTFDGAKSTWHGFDRYDYLLDETNLTIKPADPQVTGDAPGQRRCIIVAPKVAAAGNPWSWRGCYWDHQPQTEIELLNRGFHIGYITANANQRPDKKWDVWYAFLTEKHGLSKKPAFIGMSRGGEFSFTWATLNPDKVSCIYSDNPGGNREMMMRVSELARNDVPLLEVCGSIDPLLGRFAQPIENIYHQFGGRITMMIKEGAGHHPHSLPDPKPIADFITQSVEAMTKTSAVPAFVTTGFVKSYYYSLENTYCQIARESARVTCRGPGYTPCYERYTFDLPGVEGYTDIIVPQKAAPGNPWVFRVGFVDRNAVVDQQLLAKGFYIVTGPVPYNADGPLLAHWNLVYKHLTNCGFSPKPVMEGAGGAAGEVYAWAMENSEKTACVYAENAVMRSNMAKTQPIDGLAVLAKAGVPLFHVCGSLDPALGDNTRVVEKRYQELGGKITVVVAPGQGHYPLAPNEPAAAVDFILKTIH